ncbi:uncharacterized protein isoform X2 [Leptinotarsa decemlineata]|uniref:uncharacterized protein isoform X2 n=1 Tax=Leptinotarsa decemlineata TaxID=7539 RepID=UPI003D30AF54
MDERKVIAEKPKKRQKPFKLCFVNRNVPGMSNIRIGKPLNIQIITDKFYNNNLTLKEKNNIFEKYLDKLKVLAPCERSGQPITENQEYGWYQMSLTDMDRSDRRLYFHKRKNIIIEEHLMNYAKIR